MAPPWWWCLWGELCWCSTDFSYYSYCRNPTGREFFVPAGTLIGVKLLKYIQGRPPVAPLVVGRRVPLTQGPFKNRCGSSLSASPSWRTKWWVFFVVLTLASSHIIASPPRSCRACCRHPTDQLWELARCPRPGQWLPHDHQWDRLQDPT